MWWSVLYEVCIYYLCDMEKDYLYPVDGLPVVSVGDGYVDYLLSVVLASHGCVIRKMEHEGACLRVTVYMYSCDEMCGRSQFVIEPMCILSDADKELFASCAYNGSDAVIRYSCRAGILSDVPVWHTVYSKVHKSDGYKSLSFSLAVK